MEHVYTADARDVPSLKNMLKTGLDVKLARTLDLAAIIHIQRLENGDLEFTAVPLLYGSYALKQGSGTFNLQPPPEVNLVAGAPIVKGPALQQTLKNYAEPSARMRRRRRPWSSRRPPRPRRRLPPGAIGARGCHAHHEISLPMRARKGPGPCHAPLRRVAVAAAPHPRSRSPEATPSTTLAMNDTTPRHPAAPAPPADVVVPPPSQLRSPAGVPLTPFLQSAPAPNLANTGATWHTYAPGQMPRGRVIAPTDAPPLAESGVGGERLYLRGSFLVTASGENRAVLRPQNGVIGSIVRPGSGSTRVIVQYPAGMAPPAEGSAFSRGEDRPFMVTDVRRGRGWADQRLRARDHQRALAGREAKGRPGRGEPAPEHSLPTGGDCSIPTFPFFPIWISRKFLLPIPFPKAASSPCAAAASWMSPSKPA